MKLLLIRHGATAGNLERRFIGSTDEPLCENGVAQALRLRTALPRPDILFASPMLRTRQTAELAFPDMAAKFVPGLRESDFGIFEGYTAAELAHDPEFIAWTDSSCADPAPPRGESVSAFRARCVEAFRMAADGLPEDCTAAFVIHGGVIMALMDALAESKGDFYRWHIGCGEYLTCFFDGRTLRLREDGGRF